MSRTTAIYTAVLSCLASSLALAIGPPVSRNFDRLVAITNAPILVTATFVNSTTNTLRGYYYFEQIPSALSVTTVGVSLNGLSLTNFTAESGQDGDVYPGCTPWRWRLETPTNFVEANAIASQIAVQVVFQITCASTGNFNLQQFGYAAAASDRTNMLFGYSAPADAQLVSFALSTNGAPVLPVQSNQTVTELSPLIVTNTGSEIGLPSSALTYVLLNPPAGAAIDTNGVIIWTPGEAQGPGTNVITTVMTDNRLPPLSATNSFTVVVTEVNTAPVLSVQTNLVLSGRQSLGVTNTASDADLPVNSLTYVLSGPVGAAMDTNGIITWTPSVGQVPSTNVFTTAVTDSNPWAVNSQHLSVTNSFQVEVNAIHNGPTLPVLSNLTVLELTGLTVTNTAVDTDLPLLGLTYSLLSPPLGVSIDTNGVIMWTPSEGQGLSTNTVTTVVRDNGVPPLSATNSFTVVVAEVNTAPVLPAQTNRVLTGQQALGVTNSATDADLPVNSLTYVLSGPVGAAIDTNGVITWTPGVGQVPSTNVFTTVVTDYNPWAVNNQHLSATNSFQVVVNAIHNGPALPMQPNLTVLELTGLTVTNTAVDTDLPALGLTYILLNPPSGASIDTNGVIMWTPAEGQGPGANAITTKVMDNGVPPLSATNNFTVVVAEVNTAPVLPAQTNLVLSGRQALVVTNTASDADSPVNSLTYGLSWPVGAVIDTNGIITWTPGVGQVPSTNVFTTVVTDYNPWTGNNQHLSATNSFQVVVNASHNGPTLPVQPNLTVLELAGLTVTNTAVDTDLPVLGLTYSLLNPPLGVSVDTNGVIMWAPGEGQGPSTNTITAVVRDNGVPPLSATNSFTVVITEANVAPVLPAQADRGLVGQQTLVVTNTATDADLPVNSLTYLLSGPVGAAIDTNGVITWTPGVGQVPSTNVFTTVVTDFNPWAVNSQHLSATNSFQVVVSAIHNGPTLPVQPNLTVLELTGSTVTNTAADTDLPALGLTYSLIGGPGGAVIDTNGVIRWIPTEGQGPGTNIIISKVTDNGVPPLSATNSFTVVVKEANVAPGLPVQTDRVLSGRQALVVTNTASDADLPVNSLTYLLTGPAGAGIDTNGIIMWTPGVGQVPSTNVFTTVVTDYNPSAVNNQHLSATNSFTVFVNTVHNGPVLLAQPNQIVNEQNLLTITNTASDFDTPALSLNYTLLNPPLGMGIDTNGVITWAPTESQGPSTNTVITVVTDNGAPNLSATNSFLVVVNEVNLAPRLPVQTDRFLVGVQTLVVTNTGWDLDWPPNGLSYQLVGAPLGAAIDAAGIITWTPTPAQLPSTNMIATVISDYNPWAVNSQHLSATNSFIVTFTAVPAFRTVSTVLSNGVVSITWESVPGQTYRVQYKDSLTAENWVALPPDVLASGPTASATDALTAGQLRVYRVMLVVP
jgi:hypothetical protein